MNGSDIPQASQSGMPANQTVRPGNGQSSAWNYSSQQQARASGDESAVGEVIGQDPVSAGETVGIDSTSLHVQVVKESAESGEEYVEASMEELAAAAESGQESAADDLRGIEGYEPPIPAGEAANLQLPLQEVGAATEFGAATEAQQQEFLPILAPLVSTLVSSVGPAVAKGVMNKLSPRAKRVISRLPRPAAVVGAAQKIFQGRGAIGKILPVIGKLLEAGQQAPGGESGVQLDEGFINEAVQTLEVILGTDDRVRITQTSQIPWRRICALRIHFPNATYRGTGFFIGPRAIATAGHCVYLHNHGWAKRIEVIPGSNGTQKPYGEATATSFRSVVGWVQHKKPETDYGCIVLKPGAFSGAAVGSFGFASFSESVLKAQTAVLAGYPGDKPFAEMWGMERHIKTVASNTLMYDIDTVGGQSGAPVYIKRNGTRYVVGIHNYGALTGNSATRIIPPVQNNLLNWSKL